MRILLLGGTGFIGSALARRLRSRDHDVVVLSSRSEADVQLDLSLKGSIESYLEGNPFDTVINLAGSGLTSGTSESHMMRTINSDLPPRLFRAVTTAHPRKTVHLVHAASSTERLLNQMEDESEYSRSKFEGTSALNAEMERSSSAIRHGLVHVSICRIHNTYGPGQPEGRFVAHVIDQLRSRQSVALRYPKRIRDFVFLDDTVDGLTLLTESNVEAPSFAELGTGMGLTLAECAYLIAQAQGCALTLTSLSHSALPDPNPMTVASMRYGSLGNCRTDFPKGIKRLMEEV